MRQIAAEREPQSAADFMHARRAELGHALAQTIFGNGDGIVEIDGARGLHAVLFVQRNFGRHSADGGGDGRNGDCGEIFDSAVACENDDRSFLVGRDKAVEANVSSGYSSGHAASASHWRDSVVD